MSARALHLLTILALLLPALAASIDARAQYVLHCDATHVRVVCPDCIFRGGFEP